MTNKHYLGTFYDTPAPDNLRIRENTLVAVNKSGSIDSILTPTDHLYAQSLDQARATNTLTRLSTSQFILPGLIDLHIHAPQWPQLGKALHLPLQDWLQNCTFPLEAKYADPQFASQMYTSLVETLLANGTTSAVYFATVHPRATEILAEICVDKGQRAWVGKVAMDDHQQCPDFYRDETTEAGLRQSEDMIGYIRSLPGNASARVQPIITPRFIPSCTDAMLTGLGELAAETGCHVQTHCSESDWEHQYVIDRLGKTDTVALQDFGLLTRKTVLAHSNLISEFDMDIIARQRSGIAHCPYSNVYFSDCVFPLRLAMNKGLHVGLGSDISGGPSASLFDSCRHVVGSSRLLESGTDPALTASTRGVAGSRSDFIEAFYLATAGGAMVLDQSVGRFDVGYQFDAMLIDTTAPDSNLMYFPSLDSKADLFQKTLYAVTRSNIESVWVAGEQVKT